MKRITGIILWKFVVMLSLLLTHSPPDLHSGTIKSAQQELLTVRSADGEYNSPIIGNGEIVTMLGPTGYHTGYCPEDETENRTFFWAGRRLSDARTADVKIPRVPPEELIGATLPLLRMGRIDRTLSIEGNQTEDNTWTQRLVPEEGKVISNLDHGDIQEVTESFVCLDYNMAVFHTTLRNTGRQPKKMQFQVKYEFGDSDGEQPGGTRMHIRRPYPTDLQFGNVEGVRARDQDLETRPPHIQESLSVQWE
ncbi:MAG TPA: hypothetical protein VKA68_16005, partial [bacterium]|nr:hypothetical protein [bacterium]